MDKEEELDLRTNYPIGTILCGSSLRVRVFEVTGYVSEALLVKGGDGGRYIIYYHELFSLKKMDLDGFL